MIKKIITALLLLILAVVGYKTLQPQKSTSNPTAEVSTGAALTSADFDDIAPTYVDSNTTSSYISNGHKTITLSPTVAGFSCDGRQHCSQMTSCSEATYFIQHCPNTKMDGNNDGIPCEQQWCN